MYKIHSKLFKKKYVKKINILKKNHAMQENCTVHYFLSEQCNSRSHKQCITVHCSC